MDVYFKDVDMPSFHIVEDDPMVRGACEILVANAGFSARGFADPLEYLGFMQSDEYRPPVAVLLDVAMPRMNGADLVRILKKHQALQRLALVTAWPRDPSVTDVTPEVCQVLSKPFRPSEFIGMLQSLHACHRAAQEPAHRFSPCCSFGLQGACPLAGRSATCGRST